MMITLSHPAVCVQTPFFLAKLEVMFLSVNLAVDSCLFYIKN